MKLNEMNLKKKNRRNEKTVYSRSEQVTYLFSHMPDLSAAKNSQQNNILDKLAWYAEDAPSSLIVTLLIEA